MRASGGINEIIDAAAIARMTLHHHFASKDALVLAQRRGAAILASAGVR